jgi:fucose permease
VCGWTGLLIPSLIRSIEASFGQDDAGIGVVYLAYALAYASGSFAGGPLTERFGRRLILGTAVIITGMGAAGLGLAPTWPAFFLAAMAMGAGSGCLDGGANGLVLDVYREGRGQAMNLLHVSFGVGALASPLVVGLLVSGGVPWQAVTIGTGGIVALLAVGYLRVPMPSGRRPTAGGAAVELDLEPGAGRSLVGGPLLLLGIAIAAYVAAEIGVSNWVVRFLEAAPLTTATLALSLFWGGLTVGRLATSVIADRFDHLRLTIACTLAMALCIAVAVLAPSLPLSIAAFAAAGVAAGPAFPMIVAIGGDRYPERSAAVGGSLAGMAVAGSVIYPPAMGFMSVTVGLPVAMFGNALLAIACVVALVMFGRRHMPRVTGGTDGEAMERA